jgi:ribonuclease P protein component
VKILRIKKSIEFQKIGKKGKKFHSKTLLLLSLPTPEFYLQDKLESKNAANFLRVGFTVSKTVGNAVVRNYAKRRLREACKALLLEYGKNHHDYVIIARREIKGATYETILSDLRFCLRRID